MNLKLKKRVGLSLVASGFAFLLFNPINSITGFSIIAEVSESIGGYFYIIGLGILSAGLFLTSSDLEEIVDTESPSTQSFALGEGVRQPSKPTAIIKAIPLSPTEYGKFLTARAYLQGPEKLRRQFIQFEDAYKNDAIELDLTPKEKRANYLTARVKEISRRDPARLAEINMLLEKQIPKILISKKALERMRKDEHVSNDAAKYQDLILQLISNPENYQPEKIGEFTVSPRGQKMDRVAWHYDSKTNTLQIQDFLYHIKEGIYVDRWNIRARARDILPEHYSESIVWDGTPLRKLANKK